MNTLLLILSCQKTQERREACLETWLYHPLPPGVSYKFLVGRPGQPSVISGDILYCDCPDTYVALPQKMHLGIRLALKWLDFDWLYKCDDDTFVHPLRVQEYPRTRDYMGKKVALLGEDPTWHQTVVPKKELGKINYRSIEEMRARNQYHGPWAGGGVGYFLSRKAAQLVAHEPDAHAGRELYEDKFVGDVMGSHGIYLHGQHGTLRDLPLSKAKDAPFSVRLSDNIYGATSLHPCEPKVMREIWWRTFRRGEWQT